ncbi:MAG: RNA 2',3'-cyclic phosphodiesterase [Ignavibacteriales bacterium]|nr:MAG: RNA 2',3'-cyclic phosphodiesterase [Ignavibacteriales bacterium]
MIRLFLALEIPQNIRTLTLNEAKREFPEFSELKWEDENKIHLTLKFIGDVPKKMVNGISSSLQFIENYNSLKCSLSTFGFFPDVTEPRVLWAGLKTDNAIFTLLNEINNELLKKFSIPADWKKFKPHLTLLRIKSIPEKYNKVPREFSELPQDQFTINSAVLYQSILQPTGSVYKEIKKYKLK